jgi:hypothetical protein
MEIQEFPLQGDFFVFESDFVRDQGVDTVLGVCRGTFFLQALNSPPEALCCGLEYTHGNPSVLCGADGCVPLSQDKSKLVRHFVGLAARYPKCVKLFGRFLFLCVI